MIFRISHGNSILGESGFSFSAQSAHYAPFASVSNFKELEKVLIRKSFRPMVTAMDHNILHSIGSETPEINHAYMQACL